MTQRAVAGKKAAGAKATRAGLLERPAVRGIILVAILVVAAGVLLVATRPNVKPPTLEDFPSVGRTHIAEGDTHPPYNSNPPTSGWHYATPADWGIYDQQLPDETVIHNLEHGGIWISYRDASDKQLIAALKDLVNKYPDHVILTYRPTNDRAIAVAAWQHLLKMDALDTSMVVNFIAKYIYQGPENV